ncbi:hypothetical protein N7457_004658 [Penicillium paradoxum]|uniref:uncharacterized protein n=1 Tax=Penicillium paradoxum TaxID=176176 RepID=UPI0025486C68|nr:uncharacterized protein N7457_004658 [Penicillium paradoxum]KAJ5782884.1 hypothetical protein N7457_004658 [Penicillium paradoxum]
MSKARITFREYNSLKSYLLFKATGGITSTYSKSNEMYWQPRATTHGSLFAPLYQTSMIRALPQGYNYPMSRGLNCTIFDTPCEEYDNFATVLKYPGVRRLGLAVNVYGQERSWKWKASRNGKLHWALTH